MVNKSKIVPNVYKKAFESVALKGQSLAISCVEGEISYEDAFIDESKTQIGYEINFTKYFYKAKELKSVENIVARIKELEKQSEGILANILEGLYE